MYTGLVILTTVFVVLMVLAYFGEYIEQWIRRSK